MKLKDPRYDYHITVSAHIIIENKKKEILMARRPKTWEWAPGRWGLPGGKIYKEESFDEALKRKTKQELGFELKPEGLYQLKQLIIKGKQAHMYFFAAKYNERKIRGEMTDYKWFGLNDFTNNPLSIFAEFFYKDMLGSYLSKKEKLFPMSKIDSLNYLKLKKSNKYKEWFKGIINTNFDPEKVDDFKKWKLKNKTN